MVFALSFAGYDASHVMNAEECLELAKERQPALILLDSRQVVGKEWTTYRGLGTHAYTRAIPIMLFTEAGDEFDNLGDLEVKGIISLPIAPDALTRLVNRFLSSIV